MGRNDILSVFPFYLTEKLNNLPEISLGQYNYNNITMNREFKIVRLLSKGPIAPRPRHPTPPLPHHNDGDPRQGFDRGKYFLKIAPVFQFNIPQK